MKSYIALERIFKEVTRLDRIIELVEWNYTTVFKDISIKAKMEELILLIRIKHEMLSDSLVQDLLDSVNTDELSATEKNTLSMMRNYQDQSRNFDIGMFENILLSTLKCKKAWSIAMEKNDFELLVPEFEKLVLLKRENLAMHATEDCSNYDVLLKSAGVSTDYIDSVCKKIGTLLKGTNLTNGEYEQKIDFESVEEIIDAFLTKITTGNIRYCSGFSTEVKNAVESVKLVIRENTINPVLDFLHALGKALYISLASKENCFILNPVLVEGHGYLFSRLIVPNERMIAKIKKAFKKQELQNIIVNYKTRINISFDFMYKVAEYSMEKSLLNGEIEVTDLPDVWNEEMKYYLNIDPEQSRVLLMQNANWYCNKFGNAPNTILGIVFACQSFNELVTKNPKVFKNHHYHPFKEVEKIFLKALAQTSEFLPIEKKLDTKYYFDYA